MNEQRSSRGISPLWTVLVALVGLGATLAAAWVSGYYTNRSTEQMFNNERAAVIQDRRQDLYVDYLRAVDAQYRAPPPVEDEPQPTELVLELTDHHARLLLVATEPVREAAQDLTDGAVTGATPEGEPMTEEEFNRLKQLFIREAQGEQANAP